jgi:acyl-CoA thioesterase FadM
VEIVHRSTVTDDQIDALGHMNVRWYGVNADAATKALLARAELVRPGQALRTFDLYTRHHREQLAGARLAVRSGVLALTPRVATLYHELFNEDTEVLAATFVRRVSPVDPGGAFAHDHVATVEVPEHGRPRSVPVDDDPLADAPSVELLLERELAMRHPRLVGEGDVGPDGEVEPDRLQELLWGGEPIDKRPWVMHHVGPDGHRVNMAVMESRMVVGRAPRLGDRIQAFGATIAVGDKTTSRRQWVMDLVSGTPFLVSTSVGVALDLDARRATSLPPAMREEAQRNLQPDLA